MYQRVTRIYYFKKVVRLFVIFVETSYLYIRRKGQSPPPCYHNTKTGIYLKTAAKIAKFPEPHKFYYYDKQKAKRKFAEATAPGVQSDKNTSVKNVSKRVQRAFRCCT